MSVSRAKMIGAVVSVVSVPLLTALCLWLVVSPPTESGCSDTLARDLPMLIAVLAGMVISALVLREIFVGVRNAWRVRQAQDVGAGPFRSAGASVWSPHVPTRVVVAWLVNGAASLLLVVGGRFPLPLVRALDLAFEQGLALAIVGELFVLLGAGLMGAAGWMVVTRRDTYVWAARAST